jgi:sugar/nucleoside kinase (ribokinase family)
MKQVDFLVVGHISSDLVPQGSQPGGTVAFSSQTALILGCHTAMLTSAAPDFDFSQFMSDIDIHCIPAAKTTSFENLYTAQGRQQTLHGVASKLSAADIPADWLRSKIVHLAPIANEIEPEMIRAFSNSLVGLTPQGWLRRWDESGRVYAVEWPAAREILPLAAAVILSREDLLDESMLDQYRQWSRLVVLTTAAAGCTVFFGDDTRQIPAPAVTEIEPTGAGDIFAAAFLVRLHQTDGNPWEAARFANEIAAQTVAETTLDAKIARIREYYVNR